MARMLGKGCHTGPGGRDCACCNVPAGKDRRLLRRVAKHSERNAWKKSLREI